MAENHHAHTHSDALLSQGNVGARLKLAIILTSGFIALELFSGWRSHSLALWSDAGHNGTDLIALLLCWAAVLLKEKPANKSKTFGYQRAGVLAAFVNAILLVLVAFYIFEKGYQRLLAPAPVGSRLIITTAAIGFVINASISWMLLRDGRHDLNIRGAFVHMLGDTLATFGIVISGVIIYVTGQNRIDPLISLVIGMMILWSSGSIIRETWNILLEGLPKNLRLDDVTRAIQAIPGVIDVHHLHIWSLASQVHAMSGHIEIADIPPSQSEQILDNIDRMLKERYNITHTTIQFEHMKCRPEEESCSVATPANHS
ncbi:MAG: cation diffusion facilitator family transporter [Acidobacteriia bacterium]|nr:cation diffusion facilitator family transporter [Terriglobia bacterium]